MTDPTPTRAEVEALEQRLRESPFFNSSQYVRQAADMIQALRERAEAAEAERDRQYDENLNRIAMQARAENERDAARRAEAAAWNDAIEAAAETMANGDLMEAPDHEPWFINRWRSVRALRRAAPTEGEA